MAIDLTGLPQEVQDLIVEQKKIIEQQATMISKLQQQVETLLRAAYGKKSEKTPKEDSKPENKNDKDSKSDKKRRARLRNSLSADLRRETITYDIPEEDRICAECGNPLHKIGEDSSDQLEFKPAELYIKQHIRPKYACASSCGGITAATLPSRPIDKGLPGPGLLSYIITSKYQDALPLYRLEQILQRYGAAIPRSTMCDWMMQCGTLLEPLVIAMKKELFKSAVINTDDTTVPVQAPGKTKTGRIWTYVASGINSAACTIYTYSPNRKNEHPLGFLAGYKGFLQADAYPGYDKLFEDGDIIEVGCWAHARRKFFEISEAVKGCDTLANDALDFIRELYVIDKHSKSLPDIQARYNYRKQHGDPILSKFYAWLGLQQKTVLPKTPIAKAINYTLNNWDALARVTSHEALELDNNRAERSIKPIVIGRKNWLFAGSDKGGKNAAILYSLIETCKQNNVNTFKYFADILERLPTCLQRDIEQLLPYHWEPPSEYLDP